MKRTDLATPKAQSAMLKRMHRASIQSDDSLISLLEGK